MEGNRIENLGNSYFIYFGDNSSLILYKKDIEHLNFSRDVARIETMGEFIPEYKELNWDIDITLYNGVSFYFEIDNVDVFLKEKNENV